MKTNSANTRAKATVYAKVLLGATQAAKNTFDVANEFDQLLKIVRGSLELRKTLIDKTVPVEAKRAIIAEIFTGFSPELLETFKVMVEREDLSVLSRANEMYTTLAEDALDSVFIDVTTVVPLDDDLRQQITDKYSAELGRGIMLREYVDPSLVGGIILSTHGKRIDASVSSQLEKARHMLTKTF